MAGLIRAEGSRPDFYPPVRVPHNFDAGVFFIISLFGGFYIEYEHKDRLFNRQHT